MKKLLVFLLCTTSLFAAEPAGIVPRSDGSQTLGTSSLRYSDVHIKYGVDCATITVSGGIPESQIQPYKVSLSTGVMGSAIDTACRLSSATVSIANNEKTGIPATDGNVFTWDASSGMPVWNAPAAGGAAAVYPEISLQAYDFVPDGFTDTATLTSIQYQQTMEGVASSPTVTFLAMPGGLAGAVNSGRAQCVVPRSWAATDTNAYVTWGTSCTPLALGQVYLHMLVSTSSLSGIYTLYDATNTSVNCTQYVDNLVTSTFTITGLTAGQNLTVYIARPTDGVAQTIYLRSVTLGKD